MPQSIQVTVMIVVKVYNPLSGLYNFSKVILAYPFNGIVATFQKVYYEKMGDVHFEKLAISFLYLNTNNEHTD